MPPIVAKAIEFHGGSLYEWSSMKMTISSLSVSFQIEATHQGVQFDNSIIGTIGRDIERRVRVTNDAVQEWRGGNEVDLDETGTTRARAFFLWIPACSFHCYLTPSTAATSIRKISVS